MRSDQELAERNNLQAQIDSAKRAVANWPEDVKLAMGLEPTPSAEVIELRSKLDQQSKDADTLHAVIDRLEAQNAELLADANECRSRLDAVTRRAEAAEGDWQSVEKRLSAGLDILTRWKAAADPRANDWSNLAEDALIALRGGVVETGVRKSEPNEGLTPQQIARGERSGRSPE